MPEESRQYRLHAIRVDDSVVRSRDEFGELTNSCSWRGSKGGRGYIAQLSGQIEENGARIRNEIRDPHRDGGQLTNCSPAGNSTRAPLEYGGTMRMLGAPKIRFANATYPHPRQKGSHSTRNVGCKTGNLTLLDRWCAEDHIGLAKEGFSQTVAFPNANRACLWRGALSPNN